MSSSQTINAYSSIVNALCDVRVNAYDLASLFTRASEKEQETVASFVNAYLTYYSMEHERSNFVNNNMSICNWAWQLVNGVDKQYVKGVE